MTAVWVDGVTNESAWSAFRHPFSIFCCFPKFSFARVATGAAVRPSKVQPAFRFFADLSWLVIEMEMGVSL